MPATRTFVRVPPDSSGATAVALLEVNRGGTLVRIQEVCTSYQADHVSAGVNVTTTSQTVLAANQFRRTLVLQNISDTRIFCAFDATPVATAGAEVGFAIEPNGGGYTFMTSVDPGVLNAVTPPGTAGNKRLLITESGE
jgi:hypothetical protein